MSMLGKRDEPFNSWNRIVVLGQITFRYWDKDIYTMKSLILAQDER